MHTIFEYKRTVLRIERINGACGLSDSHSENDLKRYISTQELRLRKNCENDEKDTIVQNYTYALASQQASLFKFTSKVAHTVQFAASFFSSFLFIFTAAVVVFVVVEAVCNGQSTRDAAKLSAYKYRKRHSYSIQCMCVTVIAFSVCTQIHAAFTKLDARRCD